ncbi:TPA: hypothetical protein ACKFH8_005546 [Burkholderia multivorans]|nr:hypothetical protein [Burkholderia multivorans]
MADTLSWYVNWFPQMRDLNGNPLYEDSHWDVPEIWDYVKAKGEYRTLVLEAEGQIQGYAVIRMQGYQGIDGNPCGYIAFVAAAPWNRRLSPRQEYRGIGRVLIGVSSLFSGQELDTKALELHSLSGSEAFYVKIGFQRTGRQDGQGLHQFRLEDQQATRLIFPLLGDLSTNGGEK